MVFAISVVAKCCLTKHDCVGKHDIKKDKKSYSKELREKKDAKSSAMTLQVMVTMLSHDTSFCVSWLYSSTVTEKAHS